MESAEEATLAVLETIRRRLDPTRFQLPVFKVGPEGLVIFMEAKQALPRLKKVADFAETRFGKSDARTCFARMTVGFATHAAIGGIPEAMEIYEGVHTDAERILDPDDPLLLDLR